MLLGACGGSTVLIAPPSSFPTTQNLPAIRITNRVINLNGKSGYQYAKMSIDVLFSDPKAQFAKAKGENLKKLQETFADDSSAVVAAFNDVLTTDVSQKTPQELATTEGKEALRQQLIKDFNARLAGPSKPGEPEVKVVYVNFLDFVMQ